MGPATESSEGEQTRRAHLPVSLYETDVRRPAQRPNGTTVYCHCNVKTGTRASGQSAAAKYDYISRDGKYAKAGRKEVVHLESGCMPAFASSDARLYWSAADSHERSNGRLFRSLTAALPNTLDASARLELSRRFAAQVTGGELPYTLALHAGRSKEAGAADNPHLHLVFSERVNDGVERGAERWFRRAAPKKGDPASGGARKTERTKPRAWLEETRSAWAGEMNLAFERAGVDDRATSESHATQLARARAAGDTAAEAHLLLNPPSTHIGPPAKHSWEDRPGRAEALKLDRYLAAEAAAASAEAVRSAHAPDVAAAAEARSQVEELDARIAELEASAAAGDRRARLDAREKSVRAASQGGQWLDEEYQSVLARPGGRLTVGERERAVETVEGRLRADLAARDESLMATSTGSTLLGEEYGEGGAAADAQSFAERESVLERVARRVDEELGAREEALRSIPLGRQHLPAAEQAGGGGAGEPPSPAERESTVRAAERRVGEALDRREARVLAGTGDDRLLAEAAEELTERGEISGDGGLAERARVIARAETLLEADRAELELEEAELLKDAAGEELLRNARRDVLGAAGRAAQTLADGWAVIDRASAAKSRVEALGAGGMDLYHAHLADIDPERGVGGNATTTRVAQDAALSAAESDVARLGRLRAVLSDESAAARYREVLDDSPGRFDTADLDRALAGGEREREERAAAAVERLAAREESVRATSQGGQWLDEAHRSVRAGGAGGRLTPGERERAVETVEGRLRADLAAREESLMATSTGSTLLGEEYGEGGAAADAQSFAERESVLERVARRVDEELGSREEALRSIPEGWRHLSAAEQARAGGAAGEPPSAAERESMVRAAERRVGEELDRREQWVLSATGDDRLLAEAAEELTERGAVSGDGGLAERARVIARAADLLQEEYDALELEEGDLLRAAGGREFLRNARREVLGADDDREADTLADDWAVINQASAAKSRVEALGAGGMELYHAHLADIDPKWGVDGTATTTRGNQDAALAAAESDGARLERLRAVLSDESAAARYREVLDDGPVRFDPAALDGALAAGERERAAARRAADLETATDAAQAAAARSDVKLRPDGVRAIYETGETHAAGLAAVERTTEALDAAADQRLPTSTIIGAWNANRSEPGGIASALAAATATARLEEERAAAEAARRKRQAAIEKRNSRVEEQLADPASARAFIAALDVEDRLWRAGTSPDRIDRALDEAELGFGRRKVATWQHREHQVVLEAEQRHRGVPSAAWRDTVDCFKGQTAAARQGRIVSRRLSDRACVRALAAEKAEPPAPRNLVQRLYDWLRTRIEQLFGRSSGPSAAAAGPEASAERRAEAARPPPTAFEERYCRKWPEHAADIRRPDFEKLAAGASGRNRLFEREEPHSSRWTPVEPGELPAALAQAAPAWSDKVVEEVTRRTTVGAWDRTERRQVTEAHLSDYENRLPAEYSRSAEWRAILARAEEAVGKVQNRWWYKWADRRKDDRKKRELEAAAINRACGRDARRLHEKMMTARDAARPDWEVTVRIRTVQQLIRNEEASCFRQEQAQARARELERRKRAQELEPAADKPLPKRERPRVQGLLDR